MPHARLHRKNWPHKLIHVDSLLATHQRNGVSDMPQMAGVSWTDLVQAISAALTVVIAIGGFAFVHHQIRQVERQMRGETHGKIFNHYSEITKTLQGEPSLRPYFYEKAASDADDPNYSRVQLLAEMFVDFFEHLAVQIENLPARSVDCWEKTAYWRYDMSPAIQAYLEKNKQLYPSTIYEMIGRGEKRMKETMARR
jgi:hypothetical protein